MGAWSISGACTPNGSQEASGGSFGAFLGPAPQMPLRRPLEAHLEQFWGLLLKWLSGGLWRLILGLSGACSPNGTQEASGSLF